MVYIGSTPITGSTTNQKSIMNKVIKDFLIFAGQSLAFIVTAVVFVMLFTLLFGIIIAIFQ